MRTKIFLLFILVMMAYKIDATEIKYKGHIPSQTLLKIVKASWGSFDVFELSDSKGRSHELICDVNSFYENKKSLLKFINYYGVEAAQYELDDIACVKLFKFLQATFEGVSNEDPIVFTLNNKEFKIERVLLPPLNPLQHETPSKNQNEASPKDWSKWTVY